MIAEVFRRLLKQGAGLRLDHRRVRILSLPRSLKYVAARDLFAAQIAGFARNSAQKLELVVIGLELVVGHSPVLQVHVGRNGGPAVTGEGELERLVVPRQPAPGRAGPAKADDDDVSGLELRGHSRVLLAQVLDTLRLDVIFLVTIFFDVVSVH